MTHVFRLVRRERAAHAMSGEGARLFGGRWNPPGTAVVYASESRALAVLEAFVHLALEARTMSFVLYTIRLPARLRVRHAALPASPQSSEDAGRAWIDEGRALALVVPSVLVPQEKNFVLNARHPHFARLEIATPEPFSFDERLWRRQILA